jgi:hypothetical protein
MGRLRAAARSGSLQRDRPLPLGPDASETLRALLAEHRQLTERLAPDELFAAAGRPATGSETARRELDRAWRETQRFFPGITHIRDPKQAHTDRAEVVRWFAVLEDLLAAQLRAVPYWSLDEELQEIARLEHPTVEGGDAELQFFETLRSPAWVPLLARPSGDGLRPLDRVGYDSASQLSRRTPTPNPRQSPAFRSADSTDFRSDRLKRPA